MSHGELVAQDILTQQPTALRWRDGRFVESAAAPESSAPPPRHVWVGPPLLDLQVNGYAGVDFQQDGLSTAQLLHAARQLARAGCSRFLLTLITDDWTRLLDRLSHLRRLREGHDELKRAILGWHIEGPFLSSEPGFRGAHNASFMLDPTPHHIHELHRLAGHDPLLITLAPERSGAIEAIREAAAQGIVVSLGHIDASARQLAAAIAAGVRAFTHLGNACPRTLDRHDNIVWRVLDEANLPVTVIPDGIHVSPALFRLIHRLRDRPGVIYVTDAMSAAGAPPGLYPLGSLELEVGKDQIVRQPGQSNFAGSALRPIDGVLRAATMLNESWTAAWARFSDGPAALLKCSPGLSVGESADFCVVRTDAEGRPTELQTWLGGVALEPISIPPGTARG